MELWIRSQDNKRLFKAEEIEYIHRLPGVFNNKDYYAIDVNECEFGEYKTKERALEVLDEIQDLLKPRNLIYTGDKIHMKDAAHLCKITNSQSISLLPENANVTQLGVLVYEMPKE